MTRTSLVYDPVAAFVRLLHNVANHILEWQLDSADERSLGELHCAALHVQAAARHMLKANGRKPPEETS